MKFVEQNWKQKLDDSIWKAKEFAKWKLRVMSDWYKNHKEIIIVFGSVVAGSVIELLKIQTKR